MKDLFRRFYASFIPQLVGDSDSGDSNSDSGDSNSDSGEASNSSGLSFSSSDEDISDSSSDENTRQRRRSARGRQGGPGDLSQQDLRDIPPADDKPYQWPS